MPISKSCRGKYACGLQFIRYEGPSLPPGETTLKTREKHLPGRALAGVHVWQRALPGECHLQRAVGRHGFSFAVLMKDLL